MLTENGFELFGRVVDEPQVVAAREKFFRTAGPGTRCLLDHTVVQEIVGKVRTKLVEAGRLPAGAVAIQAIAFDKTPGANWKSPGTRT